MRNPILISLALAATAASIVTLARPVRSSLGGDGVEGSEVPSYTAADYIQDGLIAMWDGIENAGLGVHDDNAPYWVELVCGGANFAKPTSAIWVEDGLYIPQVVNTYVGTTPGASGSFVKDVDQKGYAEIIEARSNLTLTVEMSWWQKDLDSYSESDKTGGEAGYHCIAPFGFLNYTEYNYELWGVSLKSSAIRINAGNYWQYQRWISAPGGPLAADTNYNLSFVLDGVDDRGWIKGDIFRDGVGIGIMPTLGPTSTDDPYPTMRHTSQSYTFRLNGAGGYKTGINGQIRFIRLYSRALTPEEVRYNHYIDRRRYGL